jgi:hypothetical protein
MGCDLYRFFQAVCRQRVSRVKSRSRKETATQAIIREKPHRKADSP